jgi:flagellar basal-body rod protein FlgB
MSISSVMGLASLKAEWLTARQEVLSQNIANANTPGYKSKDIVQFSELIESFQSSLISNTAPGTNSAPFFVVRRNGSETGSMNVSGNDVSLDTELLKIGETTSQYSLNTNIIKSFHRMIVASLKG